VNGFAPEYDHNTRKTSKRNRDLRRRTESFTRFHRYGSSSQRSSAACINFNC
jgi:hypothetical protein